MRWIWQQEGSPGQRARGLAAGIFCGCFPFFGLQTLLGIALASVVRGNHLLAAAGTWISNPFTYVPLYWFNYHVGDVSRGEELLQQQSPSTRPRSGTRGGVSPAAYSWVRALWGWCFRSDWECWPGGFSAGNPETIIGCERVGTSRATGPGQT